MLHTLVHPFEIPVVSQNSIYSVTFSVYEQLAKITSNFAICQGETGKNIWTATEGFT